MLDTSNNPQVWTPPHESHLLAVLLPANETEIATEERYLELMVQRLTFLIQHWMTHYEASQRETETLLDTALTNLNPNQFRPSFTSPDGKRMPLETWRKTWAEALVRHNPILRQRLNRQAISFPVTAIANEEEKENLLSMFQDSDEMEPNLEEWLITLATKAETL